MKDTKVQKKITEARYLIIIPLVVTGICLWFDLWTNFSSGVYSIDKINMGKSNIIGTFIFQNSPKDSIVVYGVHKETMSIKAVIDLIQIIIRCGMGYLYPSLLSIVIVMIWQQITWPDESYGFPRERIGLSLFATILYSTVFITCLIKYNIWTAGIMGLSSFAYILYLYKFCLDERVKPKKKNDMTEDELLLHHLNKRKGGHKNDAN